MLEGKLTIVVKTSTPPTTNREGPLVDEEIRAPQVRLVGAEGEMLGIVATREALKMAHAIGLNLLEVSPNADPPVAKILDYGKFKYEQQKKKNEARKKQKVIEIKELKVRPNIDQNDYMVKLNAAKRFIGGGDKVKLTLRFRGREMAHQELGVQLLERFRIDLESETKVEQLPKLENRQMIMVLAPR